MVCEIMRNKIQSQTRHGYFPRSTEHRHTLSNVMYIAKLLFYLCVCVCVHIHTHTHAWPEIYFHLNNDYEW